MDSKYRFGKIDVSCEGYDHPDDPYVLRGSCGVRRERGEEGGEEGGERGGEEGGRGGRERKRRRHNTLLFYSFS